MWQFYGALGRSGLVLGIIAVCGFATGFALCVDLVWLAWFAAGFFVTGGGFCRCVGCVWCYFRLLCGLGAVGCGCGWF